MRLEDSLKRDIEIESGSRLFADGTDFVGLRGDELLQITGWYQGHRFQLEFGEAHHGPWHVQTQRDHRQEQIADADPYQSEWRDVAFDAMFANPSVAPNQIGDKRMEYRSNQYNNDEQRPVENAQHFKNEQWIGRCA